MRGRNFRRSKLKDKATRAFAPAAITNFFRVLYNPTTDFDLGSVGATGGGYILSKGVSTAASLLSPNGELRVETIVNGDVKYKARTTRRAVKLLFEDNGIEHGHIILKQKVDVPIGCGFGASSASAISAVLASASVIGLKLPKTRLAYYAHKAEILEQTGLGTVSVTFDGTGAGAITKAGGPGVSEVLKVDVPKGIRIVTASLRPYDKKKALSSPSLNKRINELGDEALRRFLLDPTLETLGEAGEWFSEELGLMTREVRKLVEIAKTAGASHASQNMIGYAIHAIVAKDEVRAVADALRSSSFRPRVDTFEVGEVKSGLLTAPAPSPRSRAP